MSVPSRRLAAAGVIAAAVIAVPAADFASGSAAPSGKPAPSATMSKPAAAGKSPTAAKSPAPDTSAAALKAAARQSGAEQRATAAMVDSLASQLGISHSAAQHALDQIQGLSRENGVDPASPPFAAIARDLGVTSARLAAALDTAKQAAGRSVAGH